MAASKKPMRNWVAIDPLMRKGGAHGVPKQQLRPRQDLRQALTDYDDWQDSNNAEYDNEGPQGPSAFLGVLNWYQSIKGSDPLILRFACKQAPTPTAAWAL